MEYSLISCSVSSRAVLYDVVKNYVAVLTFSVDVLNKSQCFRIDALSNYSCVN